MCLICLICPICPIQHMSNRPIPPIAGNYPIQPCPLISRPKYPGKAIVMHSTNHRELQVCAVTMDMDRDKWRLAFSFYFSSFFSFLFVSFLFSLFAFFTVCIIQRYCIYFFPSGLKSHGLGLCQRWIVQGNPESSFLSLKMTHNLKWNENELSIPRSIPTPV